MTTAPKPRNPFLDIPDLAVSPSSKRQVFNSGLESHQPGRPMTLKAIDLDAELAFTFNTAKSLLNSSDSDEYIPLNQRAQAVSTLSAVIQTIAKTHIALNDADKVRKLETCLLATLKLFPELQDEFMRRYTAALEELPAQGT